MDHCLSHPHIGTFAFALMQLFLREPLRLTCRDPQQMVQDLRLDSQRWRAEVQQGRGSPHAHDKKMSKHPNNILVAYQDSRTHQSRQYYGPTGTAPTPASAPAPSSADYAQPQQQQQRAAYPPQPTHPAYAAEPSYTHQAPTGYPQAQSYASPYDQGQGQGRAAPTYSYPPQGQGQDAYYASAQPRYTYPPQQQPAAPPRETYSAPQPRYYGYFSSHFLVYR